MPASRVQQEAARGRLRQKKMENKKKKRATRGRLRELRLQRMSARGGGVWVLEILVEGGRRGC
jgi:hypothetical protein